MPHELTTAPTTVLVSSRTHRSSRVAYRQRRSSGGRRKGLLASSTSVPILQCSAEQQCISPASGQATGRGFS